MIIDKRYEHKLLAHQFVCIPDRTFHFFVAKKVNKHPDDKFKYFIIWVIARADGSKDKHLISGPLTDMSDVGWVEKAKSVFLEMSEMGAKMYNPSEIEEGFEDLSKSSNESILDWMQQHNDLFDITAEINPNTEQYPNDVLFSLGKI